MTGGALVLIVAMFMITSGARNESWYWIAAGAIYVPIGLVLMILGSVEDRRTKRGGRS